MLVNHVKEFLKFFQTKALFSQLFAWASTSMHIMTGTLTSKLFDLISLFWHDLPKNCLANEIYDDPIVSNVCCSTYSLFSYIYFMHILREMYNSLSMPCACLYSLFSISCRSLLIYERDGAEWRGDLNRFYAVYGFLRPRERVIFNSLDFF